MASNSEIARELVVSDATAKIPVSNVLSKLGLRERVQGVVYAYENGLVAPGQESELPWRPAIRDIRLLWPGRTAPKTDAGR